MSRYKLKLIPQNPLFFRDGKPFGGGETFHADTIFPPYPSTFMGMLRTLLIELNGGVEAFKNGKIEWIGEIEEKDNGERSFKDEKQKVLLKYIVINKSDKEVFPIPADVAKKIKEEDNDEKNCTKDKKTEEIVKFSWVKTESLPALGLGEFEYILFNKYDDNREPVKGRYIKEEEFKNYLLGQWNDDIKLVEEKDVYVDEEHIKNSLVRETKQTRDEAGVYMYNKKRMKDDAAFEMIVEIEIDNPFNNEINGYVKLGGENGIVKYEVEKIANNEYLLPWEEFQKDYNKDSDLLKIVFVTPTISEGENIIPQKLKDYFDVKGIAVKGTVSIGGWDMIKNMPKDMYKAYTPGTVLLVESKEKLTEEMYNKILETNFSDIKSEEGFGAVVLGIEKNVKNN